MPPARGEVWYADLNPTRDHEQAGTRPVLVVSADEFNRNARKPTVIIPLTTGFDPGGYLVRVDPPEGGLRSPSYALCAQIRSVSANRLGRRLGRVSSATLDEVERNLEFILGLR
ncbi:MAG TPA: type II toxin-antitoxin system PemK/MazF family toxin [Longimicrobium sp.]